MSTREERSLEFNVISASDLKKVKASGYQNCFVVIYIQSSEKKSTKVDYTGGRNPLWNSKITLTCEERFFSKAGDFITAEIYSYGRFINKLVGAVSVPLHEVARGGKSGAIRPQVLGYQVRRRSGRIQGILNMSVKLGEKKTISTLPPPRCYGKQRNVNIPPAYPQFRDSYYHPEGQRQYYTSVKTVARKHVPVY